MRLPLLAALPALLALSMSASAQDYRQLKGPEITTTLSGAEYTDESDWSFVFERGGRLRSVRLSKPGTGTWKVENDELCTTNGPGMVPCHQVWLAGTRLQLRRADEVGYPEEGILKRSSAPAPTAKPAPAPGAKPAQPAPAQPGAPSPRPARPPQ